MQQPLALLSLADADKSELAELAASLATAGYRFCATAGTARALATLGHRVETLTRVGEEGHRTGRRSVLDAIASGDVSLVVNTPSPESAAVADAGQIRRAALGDSILCLTSIDTALAAAATLEPGVFRQTDDVRPLQDWLAAEAVPV